MADAETIKQAFLDEGIQLDSDAVSDPDNPGRYSAFVQISRNAKGNQTPSKLKLKRVVEKLKAQNIFLIVILLEGSQQDITATIKTALDVRFSSLVNNVFANTTSDKSIIWVEPKRRLDETTQREVAQVVIDMLQVLAKQSYQIEFTSSATLPTPTAVLSAVRTLSPVTQEQLITHLLAAKFDVPNSDWMARMLDKLRKSGKVIKLRSSTKYALSFGSLKALGSRKDRRSPDIIRALALAQRRD